MKILIATHHLDSFTGTVTFTYELAKNLQNYKHSVIVYAKYISQEIAKFFFKSKIKITNQLENIRQEKFDIAHVHHNITAYELRLYFPKLPVLYVQHGLGPFLEQAPTNLNISHYCAVSNSIIKKLKNKKIETKQISLIKNLVDIKIFNKQNNINTKPNSALIINSNIRKTNLALIKQSLKDFNIKYQIIGKNFKEVAYLKLPKLINQHDLIFATGRGAIESMACGRAVIITGPRKFDGLVTTDNYHDIKKENFTGNTFSFNFSKAKIKTSIKKYNPQEIKKLSKQVRKDFASQTVVLDLVKLYKSIIKNNTKIRLNMDQKATIEYVNCLVEETRKYTYYHVLNQALNRAKPKTLILSLLKKFLCNFILKKPISWQFDFKNKILSENYLNKSLFRKKKQPLKALEKNH